MPDESLTVAPETAAISSPSHVETWIRRTTMASVLLLAGIAAVVSFRHMHELALAHGEDALAAALIPLAVDGTIVAASMSLLLASRNGSRGGPLPWCMLLISSLASLAANIAVAEPTITARLIAGWPSLALIGAYEMLMSQVRSRARSRTPADQSPQKVSQPVIEPDEPDVTLQQRAWRWAQEQADHEGKVPTGTAIARQFQRSSRWGRLVKKAGLTGELA